MLAAQAGGHCRSAIDKRTTRYIQPRLGHAPSVEFAPATAEGTGILPGLPAVAGKPVHIAFDGGRTSDAGILLLAAVEQRLKIAERLAACLEDPRDPDRVRHELAEMIR
ncbi:MAG: transposase, partial [Methylocella sp.]